MNIIPKGLKQCPVCGEYKGKTKLKYFNWEGHPLQKENEKSKDTVTISCICEGVPCHKCKKTMMRRPISNEYDPGNNTFWHSAWFTGIEPCEKCKKTD